MLINNLLEYTKLNFYMKKCCFIIPYFGRFNEYFPLFLKSCAYNKDFNWLIFTDDKTKYDYPENVKVVYQSFVYTLSLIKSKFNCVCNITKPYKLCDLKPMYGYIFEDYLSDYEFWGYCDVDTIMGNLSYFLPIEKLRKYDKLFCLGHMTIFRNTQENNYLFMKGPISEDFYKEVLSTDKIFAFDEISGRRPNENIHHIFKKAGKKLYEEDLSLNVNIRYPFFVRIKYCGFNGNIGIFRSEKFKKAIYIWDNGNLYRLYKNNTDKLKREDFLYIHLQRRSMSGSEDCLNFCKFQIAANKFLPLEVIDINCKNFRKIRKLFWCDQYFKVVIYPGLKKRITDLTKNITRK